MSDVHSLPTSAWRWPSSLRDRFSGEFAPQVEEGLRQTVMRTLKPAALALAGVYFGLAFVHALTLPPVPATLLALIAAASALALVVLHLQLRRNQIDAIYAHDLAGAAFMVQLAHGLVHLALVRDAALSVPLILNVVGAGLVFLSWRWLALAAGATLGAWSVVAWRMPASESWTWFGFGLVCATLLAFFVFAVRVNALERLETLRLLDARHQRELARALDDARAYETDLGRLVDSACAAIVSLDATGRITRCGGRAPGPFLLDPGRVVGRWFDETWARHPELVEAGHRALEGEPSTRVLDFGGKQVRVHWAPVKNHAGHTVGATGVAVDITTDAEALEARTRGAARLRQLEHARDLARLRSAHTGAALPHVRAQLAPLDAAVEDLRVLALAQEDANIAEACRRIDARLDDLDRSVLQLEEAARLDAHAAEFEVGDVDLAALGLQVVKSRLDAAACARVSLDFCGGDAPRVQGDADRLREALEALVDNALAFAPQGSRVALAVMRQGARVVAEVRDEGPALAPEDARRLAAPFDEAIRETPVSLRAGRLSLLVARSIAERHGGALVAPRAPEGASFRLELPAM